MLKILQEALTFDDVLLVPAESSVLPKDTLVNTHFTRNIELDIPLVSAAMDTVSEANMAIALSQAGGISVLHKNMSAAEQVLQVQEVKQAGCRVAAAVGAGLNERDRIAALIDAGTDAIVVDTAHGHSKGVLEQVYWIKQNYPHIQVVGGNIATADAARALVAAGADAVKVGIGPGSICTTRIVTGVGVPQITAISNVAEALKGTGVCLIADGGIRFSGDICKALAAGADTVMIGNLFAGTEESPGELHIYQGQSFKAYRGMGSLGAMSAGSKDRYFQGHIATDKLVPEGIEGVVPYKGSVINILQQLIGGLRSCLGYTGSANLHDLRHNAQFMKISAAAMRESHVHDVRISKVAPNYSVGDN